MRPQAVVGLSEPSEPALCERPTARAVALRAAALRTAAGEGVARGRPQAVEGRPPLNDGLDVARGSLRGQGPRAPALPLQLPLHGEGVRDLVRLGMPPPRYMNFPKLPLVSRTSVKVINVRRLDAGVQPKFTRPEYTSLKVLPAASSPSALGRRSEGAESERRPGVPPPLPPAPSPPPPPPVRQRNWPKVPSSRASVNVMKASRRLAGPLLRSWRA
mmetsp:Transcript_76923/g.195244  ORF Transcript_76923/g.195244 Transcript_76923/m.195244 type:complete len:216 (-) Transcript_76923:259-906(-)